MRSSGSVARTWSIASAGGGALTSTATATPSALVSPLGRCLRNQLMPGRYPRSRRPLVRLGGCSRPVRDDSSASCWIIHATALFSAALPT